MGAGNLQLRTPRTCRAAAALMFALAVAPAHAYETDQLSNRWQPIADSTEVLNREVNAAIADIAADWDKGHDELAFVNAIYRRIGGLHWVDRLEKWAMRSDEVDKLRTPRYRSIYAGLPPWALRVTNLFGIGATLRVNDELIGSDKIGHFISQGRKFYRRYVRMGSEQAAARQSAFTERAIFGRLTTGAYSNADLVANYEGYRFYRSLFEDDVIAGKPSILRWDGERWIVQREFDWADHVNAYWDEALNPNFYDWLARKHMRRRLIAYCGDFWIEPELYMIADEAPLQARYAHIGLVNTRHLRLDALCTSEEVLLASADELPESRSFRPRPPSSIGGVAHAARGPRD